MHEKKLYLAALPLFQCEWPVGELCQAPATTPQRSLAPTWTDKTQSD